MLDRLSLRPGLRPRELHYADAMYDHNQTLVPDSFLALHSTNGRATLSRQETEARYATCEDLALHTAAFLDAQHPDPDEADETLRRCYDGLRAEPASLLAIEAAWVVQRVAELQEWPQPAWLAAQPGPARP